MIHKAYIVPGQPHLLLAPEKNAGWASLRASYEAVGREIAASGAELILVYSTQWFSVIGHLFQIDPAPKWILVDQNWYELGEIPYELRVDPELGKLYCALCKQNGMQAATVDYHGFPIDTGTVVALKLLDPGNAIPASVVSCNIYAEREETRALGMAGRAAIEQYGKKTIVVVVTNLSNRYEVGDIDPAADRISSAKDDEWNRKILEMLGEGRLEDVAQVARDFAREANADMGFKAIWWLAALMGEHNRYDGKVWDYQPVWGTGNAIVELTPNPRKEIEWEKEFDEGAPVTFADSSGTGLETHNLLRDVTPSESEGPGGRGGAPNEATRVAQRTADPSAALPPRPLADARGDNAVESSGTNLLRDVTPSESEGPGGRGGAPNEATRVAQRTADPSAARPPRPLADARGDNAIVTTPKAAPPIGPYPHARRVGDLLFLSGVGPRQPGTGEIPGPDIETQTRAAIANVTAILEAAGSSLDKVLDVTVYLTDMKRDFDRFNRTYAETLGKVQPARTTVGVDSLPTPILVELKVIASA